MDKISHLAQVAEPFRSLVEFELKNGEIVQWVGRPDGQSQARRLLLPLLSFVIPCILLAVFLMISLPRPPEFRALPFLVGLPVLLFGVALLSLPLLVSRKMKKILYILTDRRALIVEGGRAGKVRSFGADQLSDVRFVERADGSGDLVFDKSSRRAGQSRPGEIRGVFLSVPNIKGLEELVRGITSTPKQFDTPPDRAQ